MAQHKWAKEIKAWADGAEIEYKLPTGTWKPCDATEEPPQWLENVCYRIKPQPKEQQYLYVYWGNDCSNGYHYFVSVEGLKGYKYIGKIKLETEDE